MRPRLLTYSLLVLLLTSCLPDDSDDCCGVTLHFRYMQNSEDRFVKDIKSMRHFLFDENGVFLREVFPTNGFSDRLLVRDLGKYNTKYKMITIGNMTEKTQISELVPGVTTLSGFSQQINTPVQNGYRGNGDQLFYNCCSFSWDENSPTEYICDLSNIHCHLYVWAYWDHTPRYHGDYSLKITNIPASYSLSPDSTRRIRQQLDDPELWDSTPDNTVQLFPLKPTALTQHAIEVLPYNYELEGEFITERYTNEYVPVLRLFCNDEPITNYIDLERAFTYFRWYPDSDPAQEYWIKMEIHEDGSVDLNRWIKGEVADWIDGGTIGG